MVREGSNNGWRAAARALAGSRVSVIVAGDHAAAVAARDATTVIPIVAIDFERDPIADGLVQSLARPAGNVTGFFCDFGDAMSRLARVLRDVAPQRRLLIASTDGDTTEAQARALRKACEPLGIDVDTLDLAVVPVDTLVDRVATWRAILLVLASPRLQADATRLAKRAMRRKLVSGGSFVRYAQAGGLLARGPMQADTFRRAATMVDRLLRGARAADLSVERPPRFELLLNVKTAAALEIAVPPALLSSADQIIR